MSSRSYIDISAAVHSRAGLGRYSRDLALALLKIDPERFALFYNCGRDGKLPDGFEGVPRKSVNWGYKPWRMAMLMGHLGRVPFNRMLPDAQLFHSTEHLLMPLRGVPTVLTVHDLIFKLFPEHHKKLNYWYLNWAMPIYCRNADAIIAVSEATKRDCVKYYDIDPAKITVIHEAASPHFQPPLPTRVAHTRRVYALPKNFLVHVSTIEPRKNLRRLLRALKMLHKDFPELHLVLVGSRGWLFNDFFEQIETDGLTDFVHALGWVDDEDLPAIIAAADLAVQPSLYEGFGLPILEHMACGQVVAAADASSFPEVGGDAAVYFDPRNVEEMAAVIAHLLRNPNEIAHRRQLGLAQAAQFSWERTARETIAVYDKLLARQT